MHTNPTPSQYLTAVVSGPICKMLGVQWAEVLAAEPEIARRLAEPSTAGLVLARDYMRLWNTVIRLSPVPDTTRLLGQRMARGPAIPVLFALTAAPDLATGLTRMAKYKSLFGPVRWVVSQRSDRVSLQIVQDTPDVPMPDNLSSPQIVFLHEITKGLAVQPFSPLAVSLPLSLAEREGLADVFGVLPENGPPMLQYRRSDAHIPFVSENAALWQSTEADLKAAALITSKQTSVVERVRACFVEAFAVSEPTIAYVCSRLHMSRSTLLRRLRAEGTTFQAELAQTRRRLAVRYLTQSELTNQQIAYLVGYVDPNAFQRAFRKWTGQTPLQVRRAELA
jgi:AraC-like DNA-binding protein